MSQPSIDTLTRPSGASIAVHHWPSQDQPIGVIQLLHGIAEHCGRYQRLAEFLTLHGWHVVAHNHRGHGPEAEQLGHCQRFTGEADSWSCLVDDAIAVSEHCRQRFDGLPLLLLGHSMGSFMAQHCVMRKQVQSSQPAFYDGLILSGSNLPKPMEVKALQAITRLEQWRLSPAQSSKLIAKLSFGHFNKQVNGQRTDYDWLSRDPEQVDRYLDDELCGFDCSIGFWQSFCRGLLTINARGIAAVDQRLALYILSGKQDPVGGMGVGVSKLATLWRQHGNPVDVQLYANARHELFNEINYRDVYRDLLRWLTDGRKKTA
ncbi:alpha-beta hydrolase superfamily lysophospholipase [Sinobacterium caligoides]|uniref:Alpha-beta hydrolase superfamily lysophospholipase n=1 Tax=Sinobacterium caligoides TaxID=933926 RepID=A0A3N2DDW2_9GAMM|nr:alpha/beta fold hydrolase [Sinobacterium caligoides]ROR97981.1 alpha-beta hydrolase superfamily lysophospholipase [Sinobacterium caligoides]